MNDAEYLRLAELEDKLWHFEALHRHVLRAVAHDVPTPSPHLLDAGCGTGGLLKKLRRRYPDGQFRGIDLNPLAVRAAAARAGCPIDEGSVTALPYPDGAFDAVTSIDVIYHVEHPAQALAEFARCLRPGGVVILNVPAYRWLWSYHDVAVHSFHRFTRRQVSDLLHDAGFSLLRATYWNSFLFPAVVIRRKLLPAPADGQSDVHAYPRAVDACLRGLLALENGWLRTGLTLPFGTSVFAVARRRS